MNRVRQAQPRSSIPSGGLGSTRARIDQLTGAVFTVRGSGQRELGLQGTGRVGVEATFRPVRHGTAAAWLDSVRQWNDPTCHASIN